MPIKLVDIVDIDILQELFESFSQATGIVVAVLDLEGDVLVAAGWQDICTQFHRQHPGTALRCRESDTCLASQLKAGERYSVYRCRNGLVDVAVPIIVAGDHVGNLFTGQFFFSPPDEAHFRRQAAGFGFDETASRRPVTRSHPHPSTGRKDDGLPVPVGDGRRRVGSRQDTHRCRTRRAQAHGKGPFGERTAEAPDHRDRPRSCLAEGHRRQVSRLQQNVRTVLRGQGRGPHRQDRLRSL